MKVFRGLDFLLAHRDHRVVDVVDMVADDHLILAAGLDDGDDAVGLLEHFGLGLALVLQNKAQAGDAVLDAGDVALAAHILDDDAGKAVVLACHKLILLYRVLIGVRLKLHPDPAALLAAPGHAGQRGAFPRLPPPQLVGFHRQIGAYGQHNL